MLIGLIDQALAGNQELKILNENFQIASNEILARRGAYLPFVTAGGGPSVTKPSLYTPEGAVENQLHVLPGVPFPTPLPNFLGAANFYWRLDIWRELRNARDAAALRFLRTFEGRNYVVTRLVAEIADNYYELLALTNGLRFWIKSSSFRSKAARSPLPRRKRPSAPSWQSSVSRPTFARARAIS